MKFPRRWIGLGVLAAIASVTVLADQFLPGETGADGQPDRAAEAGTVRSQLRADVHRSLQVLEESVTLEEWRSSGFMPEDILRNAAALRSREAWTAVCVTLGALGESDLAFYGDAIEKYRTEPDFDCSDRLLSAVRQHWKKKEFEFNLKRAEARGGTLPKDGGARPQPALRPRADVSLPSEERVIDPAVTHVTSDGGLRKGEIAITLDDGPHESRTERILEILRDAEVRATYFQIGRNAMELPAISRKVALDGHSLGSHSYDHSNLPKLTLKNAQLDISQGRDDVASAGGVAVPFFRFPYGASNQALRDYVSAQGMTSFLWNMDSLDWKLRDPETLFRNVLRELDREQGGIVLFHDIHEQTVIVLPAFLEELQKRGFKTIVFVPPQAR